MINNLSITLKHKSQFGQIDYSNAYGQYSFKGSTTGLALKYVAKGKEIYCINDQITPVTEGHFILVRPNTDFEANTKKQAEVTQGLCIDLSNAFPKTDIKKMLFNDLMFTQTFSLANSTAIGQQLNRMSFSMEGKVENVLHNEPLFNIVNQLHTFSENIFQYKKQIYSVAKKDTTQQYLIHKLLHAKEYIMRNYKERIILDQLAQHVGMSKFQLLKLFQICFNCSPKELQSILRMQEAKSLLLEKNDSISKIAFDLGYFDAAAFSKKFKSHFGVAPSLFKN